MQSFKIPGSFVNLGVPNERMSKAQKFLNYLNADPHCSLSKVATVQASFRIWRVLCDS